MEKELKFDDIVAYSHYANNAVLHPLINVLDLSKSDVVEKAPIYVGFYTIFLRNVNCDDIRYGKHPYDYQGGTLVLLAPGQTAGFNKEGAFYQPKGYALVIHPDYIHGCSLDKHMKDYTFFEYRSKEALHISNQERQTVKDCFNNIKQELKQTPDKHSKRLIISYLELLLNYCMRFYERQFSSRSYVNRGAMENFDNHLNEYLRSDKPQLIGFPSVAYFADGMNLSVNYFGDLVKKRSGKTPSAYIRIKMMEVAKEKLLDRDKTISEIAYGLGFQYPQHFSRVFKRQVGQSPSEYRQTG